MANSFAPASRKSVFRDEESQQLIMFFLKHSDFSTIHGQRKISYEIDFLFLIDQPSFPKHINRIKKLNRIWRIKKQFFIQQVFLCFYFYIICTSFAVISDK
jgi:hypothetical protein